MKMHFVIQGVFVLVGVLSVLASLFNWDWFFTAQNAQFFVTRFGRQWARVCYAILGGVMIFIGIYFYLTVRAAMPA